MADNTVTLRVSTLARLLELAGQAPEWKRKDHACPECVPGGDMVKPDFRCAIHTARAAYLAGVKGLVMADGSPLLDYLNVGDDPPETDEWTKGFHEARRRLYRILAPQLTAGVLAAETQQGGSDGR